MNEKEKLIYDILCSDETPPKGHHWEGFVASKIVIALEKFDLVTPADIEQLKRIAKLVEKIDPYEPKGEKSMKTFDTYEEVVGMNNCMKRPIVVQATQVDEPFRVNTLEGNYKQGKSGDYLMRGIDGELYICDKEIFEKTYNWV